MPPNKNRRGLNGKRKGRMLIFNEMKRDEQICAAEAGRSAHLTLRLCTRCLAIVGLAACSLLLMPVLVEAAMQDAKPLAGPGTAAMAVAPPTGSAETRMSPYVIANRQHTAASREPHSPTVALSVRGPHQSTGRVQRQ